MTGQTQITINDPPTGDPHICAYSARVEWTSEKIRRRRREHGLSQEQLADLLGVSRSAVQQWETDKRTPGGASRRDLQRVLGDNPTHRDATLAEATDLQLLAELTRRLAARHADDNGVALSADPLRWDEDDRPVNRRRASQQDSPRPEGSSPPG